MLSKIADQYFLSLSCKLCAAWIYNFLFRFCKFFAVSMLGHDIQVCLVVSLTAIETSYD